MNSLISWVLENYVLVIALGCIPFSGFFLWKTRDLLGLSGWKLTLAPLIYVIVGLSSIVVFSIIQDLPRFPDWRLHHQGILIVFPLFFPLFAKLQKIDLRDVSDALTVSIPGIIAATRISCLMNGCCYGRYFPGTEVNIPLREIVIIANLLASFVLLKWIRKRRSKGFFLPGYMVFYGVFRFAEVALRFNPYWTQNSGNRIFALFSIIVGLFLSVFVAEINERERQRKTGKRRKRMT